MAWEQIAVHDEVTLHHDVVDGLSTYWVEGGGAFRAVLAFRIGMADETLPTRGICHLVEHLAIEPQPRLYAHIGWSPSARSSRRRAASEAGRSSLRSSAAAGVRGPTARLATTSMGCSDSAR